MNASRGAQLLENLPVSVGTYQGYPQTADPTPESSQPVSEASVQQARPRNPAPPALEEIFCSYDWPQGCGFWLDVSHCESTYRADAVSSAGAYGGYFVGVLQVWTGHGYTIEELKNPATNVAVSWGLSRAGEVLRHWPVCRYQ